MNVAPVITSVVPDYGRTGDTITVTGTEFGPYEGDSDVQINGVDCEIVSWSDTVIICKIPQATSGNLVVRSRLNDVTDYGATGDGNTDDTEDIQDATDDLPIW